MHNMLRKLEHNELDFNSKNELYSTVKTYREAFWNSDKNA